MNHQRKQNNDNEDVGSVVLSLGKDDLRSLLVNLPASARFDFQVNGEPVGSVDDVLMSSDWFVFKRVESGGRVTYVVNAVNFSDLEDSLEEG